MALGRGNALHRRDLVDQLRLDILGAFAKDPPPPEADEIHEGRMRAHGDPGLPGQADGAAHDNRIARVEPAGHVRRRHRLQHLAVIADRVGAEAFAHVAVEVQGDRHSLPPGILPPGPPDGSSVCLIAYRIQVVY